MISLMIYFLEKDMTEESRLKFRDTLECPTVTNLVKEKVSTRTVTGKKFVPAPKERWKAPPGWTPPGWNEEKSYQEALKVMSFNANPK